MATVVLIGCGRNDPTTGEPMEAGRWADYRYEVLRCVTRHCGVIYFNGTGAGYSDGWGDEEAYTVIAEDIMGPEKMELTAELAQWRRFFGQEAVAVTFGQTYFV